MPRAIRITAGSVAVEAELNDSTTAAAIAAALPIEAKGDTWTVALGELGYWPPGKAFCIFFGPTPMSRGDEIRPASAVNVVGRIVGDARVFKRVRAGTRVTIEAS